jgi:hypothetical protein
VKSKQIIFSECFALINDVVLKKINSNGGNEVYCQQNTYQPDYKFCCFYLFQNTSKVARFLNLVA